MFDYDSAELAIGCGTNTVQVFRMKDAGLIRASVRSGKAAPGQGDRFSARDAWVFAHLAVYARHNFGYGFLRRLSQYLYEHNSEEACETFLGKRYKPNKKLERHAGPLTDKEIAAEIVNHFADLAAIARAKGSSPTPA
jgi:hypothetical protein